jgi:hypothetical protein
MDVGTLFILGIAAAVLVIGSFVALIILAVLTYVVKNLYPLSRRVGLWVAKLENFLPLLILYVILIVLVILLLIGAFRSSSSAILAMLLILVALALFAVAAFVGMLLLLGILVYLIRLAWWLYGRWKGLLGVLMPQIMKLKIKHDIGKGKGKEKDLTTHFTEMRRKLSDEAEQARRKVSRLGK